MDQFVISDTCILIDLYDTGLLELYSAQQIEIHTTDLVVSELKTDTIKNAVTKLIRDGLLLIESIPANEMAGVLELRSGGLSITDCSVWYIARKNKWTLLTGDKNLRTKAENDGICVHGILYVMDQVLLAKCMDPSSAHEKLQFLSENNNRLPVKEVKKRLHDWSLLTSNTNESCDKDC